MQQLAAGEIREKPHLKGTLNSALSAETVVAGFPVVMGSGKVMCLSTQSGGCPEQHSSFRAASPVLYHGPEVFSFISRSAEVSATQNSPLDEMVNVCK